MVDALSARIERDARFVGDVSHELRSPLTSLVTSVEVLAGRRAELSPRAGQALTLVEGELRRFRRMLDDLLQLARLDGDATAAPGLPVSMTALAREVLATTGHPAGLLEGDPDADTVVRADKNSLERAVRNLLDNADRHAGGPSAVAVERRDGAVLVTVDDAGPGVAAADRERVFERFARLDAARDRDAGGAGLGLATVRAVAEAAGGSVHATGVADDGGPGGGSETVATGARLVVRLPAAAD
jgi:two-component system, OmpR family, sensor histidine kinase MtrB